MLRPRRKLPLRPRARLPRSSGPSSSWACTAHKPWTGDFDGMIKRRVIRILVPYSKTYYFVDRGVQRGLAYDVGQLLEQDINKKLKTGHLRVHVTFVPVARDEIIPALLRRARATSPWRI